MITIKAREFNLLGLLYLYVFLRFPFTMTSFKTKLENFVERFPVEPFVAVVIGAGMGLLSVDLLQDYLSHLAVEKCKISAIHELVEIDHPILGTSKHCISRTRIYGPTTPLKP